jgi:hypothetical protein
MFPRVNPIKAAGPVWAGGHAETASDTPVKVHEYKAVLALESGPGRADPDARRVIAMIAQDHERLFFYLFRQMLIILGRKSVFILFGPDPLNLVLRFRDVGYIVPLVAGGNTICAILGAFFYVNNHGPTRSPEGPVIGTI